MEFRGGYLCGFCHDGVVFHSRSDIQAHNVAVHLSVPSWSYKCSICLRTFDDGFVIEEHLNCHLEGKPYKCAKCDMTFSRIIDVALHSNSVHEEVSAFSCRYCDQRFPCQSSVESHIQSKHNYSWRSSRQDPEGKSTNLKSGSGRKRRAPDPTAPRRVDVQYGQATKQEMPNFGASTSSAATSTSNFGATHDFGATTSNSASAMPNFGATTSHFGGTVSNSGATVPMVESTVEYDTEMGGDHTNPEWAGDGTSEMEQDSANSYRLSL